MCISGWTLRQNKENRNLIRRWIRWGSQRGNYISKSQLSDLTERNRKRWPIKSKKTDISEVTPILEKSASEVVESEANAKEQKMKQAALREMGVIVKQGG